MARELATEVTEELGRTVIHVRGELDIETGDRLRDALEPHLGPQQTIVLDLSEVEFMDSSSLTVLLQAHGKLTADGGSLVLRNPSDFARSLLTVTGTHQLLEAEPDERPPG